MATKNTTKAPETPKVPAFDFNALTADTVEELPKGIRKSAVDYTPFIAWVKETYDTNTAKQVTVPSVQAGKVKSLVRQAASRLGIGSRIREQDNGDDTVTVTFAGCPKSNRGPRGPRKPKE